MQHKPERVPEASRREGERESKHEREHLIAVAIAAVIAAVIAAALAALIAGGFLRRGPLALVLLLLELVANAILLSADVIWALLLVGKPAPLLCNPLRNLTHTRALRCFLLYLLTDHLLIEEVGRSRLLRGIRVLLLLLASLTRALI